MRYPRTLRALAAAALGALLAAGCGKSTTSTDPGTQATVKLVVFASTRTPVGAGASRVLAWNPSTGTADTLPGFAPLSGLSEPCISDNGEFVCVSSDAPGGAGLHDLYMYRRSTGAMISIPGLNTASDDTYPRFSHNSAMLAFVRDTLGHKRIRLFKAYGDTLAYLPGLSDGGNFDDTAPAPDAATAFIAFQSDRNNALPHVYLWQREISAVLSIPELVGNGSDVEPALSSDSRWLAFASNRSGGAGGYDIYLFDKSNVTLVALPNCNTAEDERHPTISADGQTIYFTSRPDSAHRWSVYRYTLSDHVRTQVTGTGSETGDDAQPYVRGL